MQLIAGANTILPTPSVELVIRARVPQAIDLDVTAYLLAQTTQKVRGDTDMIFYGQTHTPNQSIQLFESASQPDYLTRIRINTAQLDSAIGKIAICATLSEPAHIRDLQQLSIDLLSDGHVVATSEINTQSKTEKALILAEVYNHNGRWKYRFVDQGFNGGLKPLAENFGVEVAEPSAAPPQPQPSPSVAPPTTSSNANIFGQPVNSTTATPTTPPPSSINLSKIRLDKPNSSINLTKYNGSFGKIQVNLNWNRSGGDRGKSFFRKLSASQSVDLDLGAMIEMQNGAIHIVQALGNRFGSYEKSPYAELQGDDRTGSSLNGENLWINGEHWDQIKRIVIYTYIYEGAANWAATDAIVNMQLPNQPPIEVPVNEGGYLSTCAIVELKNVGGQIQANRQVQYFDDQQKLDEHYGFGFRWTVGRK
ncbi:TerD family protein [Acinetobacter sp. ANC 3791]|uniref:TerD family protein n=1 Tax=Acinetobacter sp. ANC 3791 TaxID=2529836 RepID=UPI001039BB8D|nr:TerD family protein [Acinetobacter sp. ANC 3791]TCB84983.1 tellurium resistance protein [Acinetobacter sp. ANC 3791]